MKLIVAALAAAALGAFALFRPGAVPSATPLTAPAAGDRSAGWSGGGPAPGATPGAASERGALVYVAGEVARPGLYRLGDGARVADALARAGGMRPRADTVAVNLAERVRDGEEIVVPTQGAAPARRRAARRYGAGRDDAGATDGTTHRRHRRSRRRRRSLPPEALDLNRAPSGALAAVPGIDPALAARIVALRGTVGPFTSTDELRDVAGMTERRLHEAKPYLVAH